MEERMRLLGDVHFVINVGDSFYPGGVSSKSDPQWQSKWRDIYSKSVRSVPWYSVYGNHDYWRDPCACSETPQSCAQVNGDRGNLDYFFMPSPNWHIEHPELGLEVIGMDLNRFPEAWNISKTPSPEEVCRFTPCTERCIALLEKRTDAAFQLFRERAATSAARNLVVFSHYPTDYFWSAPEFVAGLRDASKHHIEYFAGHRHNVDQDSTTSTAPNNNWLVGGGGGWGCDGKDQGFVVAEVASDFSIKTYRVLVEPSKCCPSSVVNA